MMRESDLFAPVKRLFEEHGYTVNAEVNSCDVTAVRGDDTVVVELKRNLSVTLLAQGVERQKLGARVYVAVPKPKNYSPKKFKPTLDVLKKLELGLIFVTLREDFSLAEAVADPEPYTGFTVNKRKKTALMKEINGRACDLNTGGITGKKVITAYTEKCIYAALLMKHFGAMTPKKLRSYGAADNIASALHFNAYGWFSHPEKGVYALTAEGERVSELYPEICEYFEKKISELNTE